MVVTVDMLILDAGTALANTWNATVKMQPPLMAGPLAPRLSVLMLQLPELSSPPGTMTNPDGSRGMQDVSSALIAMLTPATSIGA